MSGPTANPDAPLTNVDLEARYLAEQEAELGAPLTDEIAHWRKVIALRMATAYLTGWREAIEAHYGARP